MNMLSQLYQGTMPFKQAVRNALNNYRSKYKYGNNDLVKQLLQEI